MSIVTSPSVNACLRPAGNKANARASTAAFSASTPASCFGPKRAATLAAVVARGRRHRRQQLRGGVLPLAVQLHPELLAEQLALREGDQQLPGGQPHARAA